MQINSSCLKAKPVFEQEKKFIEENLGISLPDNCWISGGTKYVWADIYNKTYILKFRIIPDSHKWEILKDNRQLLNTIDVKTIQETIEIEHKRINDKYISDLNRLISFVTEHQDDFYNVSISGGKDSEVVHMMWEDMIQEIEVVPNFEYIFFNTSNETSSVYRHVKTIPNIRIVNPPIGWYQWIKENKYSLPNVFRRSCCTTYKEGQLKKVYDKNKSLISVMGMRNKESVKRSKYKFYMDVDYDTELYGLSNLPPKWSKLCPIVDWTTIDIWLLILMKNWYIDERYMNGCQRVGCLICPYSSPYDDEVNKYFYTEQYSRFQEILKIAYSKKGMLLNRTFEEYANEYWKRPEEKRYKLLREYSDEAVLQIAEEKGISAEMAQKFLKHRNCGECNRRLSEIEIAMFYKLFGRFEGKEDNRNPICYRCICKKLELEPEEYFEMVQNFKRDGCNLF